MSNNYIKMRRLKMLKCQSGHFEADRILKGELLWSLPHLGLPPNLPYVARVKANEVALRVRAASSNGVDDPSSEFVQFCWWRLVAKGK